MCGAFAPIVRQCIFSTCSYGLSHSSLCTRPYSSEANPEPCSADFLLPAPRIHSNRAHPRCVSIPSCNYMDYRRKITVWKIFRCYCVYSTINFSRCLLQCHAFSFRNLYVKALGNINCTTKPSLRSLWSMSDTSMTTKLMHHTSHTDQRHHICTSS